MTLCFAFLFGCESSKSPPTGSDNLDTPIANSIVISPATIAFTAVGSSQQLTATVRDQKGAELSAQVTWMIQNSAIATITSTGVVASVGTGSTTATATVGTITTSVAVSVQQTIALLQSTVPTATLASIGESTQAALIASDANGNRIANPAVTWSSTNIAVATVSATGLITAVANGSSEIRATAEGKTATIAIAVNQRANVLQLTPPRDTLSAVGETSQLTATIRDARGTAMNGTVTWTSGSNTVATVSSMGVVTAVGRGSTTVTAQHGALSAMTQVIVDDFGDLGIGYVHRSPEIDFVRGSANPTREGWPAAGQTVTWEAKIKSTSRFNRTAVPYRWTVDGIQVSAGTIDMPAGAVITIPLLRNWTFSRTKIGFELDPDNSFGETEERNNTIEVFSDALAIGFYVERSVYDYFGENQRKLGVGSNSWEDWAQRHVRFWNTMFENARYPLSPVGVLDRVRIDKITVVPDGALPLVPGGVAGNLPNGNDRTVDLQWGFPASLLQGNMYGNHVGIPGANNQPDNPFYFESSLLHELGHARYLVDVYGFNVKDGAWTPAGIIDKGSNIAIMEAGQFVAGSPYMRIANWEHVYYTPLFNGLMGGDYYTVGEYNAAALNLIAGRRAVLGNANAPGNIGAFLNDLPAQNRLKITDAAGVPIARASVRIYQSTPKANEWYGKYFDNTPDLQLSTDAQGQVLLGRNPFGGSGIVHTYGHSNGVVIIRVEGQGRVGYTFLESAMFNLEYWRGHTALGEYILAVVLR